MKIKVTSRPGHNVYGALGMQGKLEHGFKELGHEIVPEGEDLLIVPGSSDDLKNITTTGKRIWWSHGVNWARGFENENNETLKNNYDNCDAVVYQSEFAKHMVEKALGPKDGPYAWNASIPRLPGTFTVWNDKREIKAVCCSIWRAWKRLHEIERLVRLIGEKGYKIHLYVIGKDPKDNCPFDLPKTGPGYEIEYLGMMNVDQAVSIYHMCHLGIHLAFNDYSPATVTEMMAAGLPVIVTNSGGSKDIVQDKGGTVIYTDPFVDTSFPIHSEGQLPKVDNEKFEEALIKIINNLPEYQQRNKDWVLSEANIVRQAEKFLTI